MPVLCVVPSCRHVQGKPDEDGSKLSYFSFPRDEQLLRKWVTAITACESKELKLTANSKLCSKHFGAADFFHGYASGRRYLKEGSVPSVFGGRTFKFEDIADSSAELQTVADSSNLLSSGQLGLAVCGGDDGSVLDASSAAGCEGEPEPKPCVDPVHTYCRRPEEGQPSPPHCRVKVVLQCGDDDSASDSDMEVPLDPPDCPGAEDDDVPGDGVPEVEELRSCASELERDISRLNRLLEGSRQEVQDLKERNYQLEAMVRLLKEQCERLEKKCERNFSIHVFRYSPKDVQFYTGLQDYETFEDLFRLLNPGPHGENIRAAMGAGSMKPGRPRHLGIHDELFLLLVRLRLGLYEHDLSFRFNVSAGIVSRVCKTWVAYIYSHLHRLRPGRNDSRAAVERRPGLNCSSDYGTVLTSVSPDNATIFVCPPMDLASAETLVQPDEHVDDADHKATDPSVVKGILCEMGVPEQVAQQLGQLGDGGTPKASDILSLCEGVERGVPKIRNWRLFDRPLPSSLLSVAREMLAIGVVLTDFQSPFCCPDK